MDNETKTMCLGNMIDLVMEDNVMSFIGIVVTKTEQSKFQLNYIFNDPLQAPAILEGAMIDINKYIDQLSGREDDD